MERFGTEVACVGIGSVAKQRWSRVTPVFFCAAVLAWLVAPARAESPTATRPAAASQEVRTISVQPQFYHGWPTVKTLKSGRLMLVYSGGRQDHLDPFGWIECMVSDDEGATWTWPQVLYDSTIDDRDAGILETAAGTLLVPILSSTVYQLDLNNPLRRFKDMPKAARDEQFARWKQADARTTPQQKEIELGSQKGRWMLRSTDGGLTWAQRYEIPVYNLNGPIQLSDGRILFAGTDPKKAAVWESKDDGLTWKVLSVLPTRAGEMDMVQAADGRLIIHVRGHIRDGVREQGTFQTESLDGGKTWSDPHLVTRDGYPAHLLRLRDGSLLTTYGCRTKPFGIRAKLSKDHGESWSDEFIIYGDGHNWDLGYPTTVQLKDGALLTVWYETLADSNNAVLRQSKWKLR